MLHGQFVGTHIVHILHRLHGQFVGTHIVHIGPTQVAWAICWYSHWAHRAYIGCMGNLLVPTLCTQSLHRLQGQFVGTHIVHIEPTQVAWAICWYSHCAHRAYIGCMGNLLVLTLCTQSLHRLFGQFVGTHIVHIGPTQVAWEICWYSHCAHRAYIGCMGNLLVLTLCTQGLHRLHGQFVGTHIVNVGATQVAWAICWYSHCTHRAYIGCMGNLLVPTLCTQNLHRLHGKFVGTHIVHIEPTKVAGTICWYSHCAHRAYIGCMGNLLVLTLCTQGLHRLHGQFVGTHIVHIEPTQVVWAICWYPHCAHRAYICCMGNLLVLTLCTWSLHRLHGQFVGTHIVHIEPTQVAWAICWYSHCAHRAYIGCLGNLLVPTLCTQGLHMLHGQFVGTHIVHIEPTQVAWEICWYPHREHRGYIGCMGNLLVLTLCTQGLHRLHGQFVGTHIVHIGPTQVAWAICWNPHCAHRAYIGCMGNLLVLTLCTQGLHGLHGQFVGTQIVHIEPTQVACAICWYPLSEHRGYIGCMGNLLVLTLCTQGLHRLLRQFVGTHIVHIGPTQVASAICWYSHCAHRAYIGCLGNLSVPTLCTQGLHRLHVQFVGTHNVHIGSTQVAWAICWYPHCAHRAYIGCMGNLLAPTMCTQGLHRLHGQFVGTHNVHIGSTQVAWAICRYPHCAHRAYIGCMGNLLAPTMCTQGLHRLHGQFLGTHIVHIEPTQVAWAICWYPLCEHRGYIGCMGNLLVLTLCTQGLHRLLRQFVGTHIVHIGPTQVDWAICWYPQCAHRAYIGGMGNLLVPTLCTQGLHRLLRQFVGTHIVHIGPTQVASAICWYSHCAHRACIGCLGNLSVPTLCTQGLHRLHVQFVGTHNVHIGSTQVAWAICWYPHCAHRAYIGCMGNLLAPTMCTQGLHRLHGQFVGTHNVHIGSTQVAWAICRYPHCAHRAYIGCMGNLLAPTMCTQGLHRLHGQFLGTHIVHIEPTQVAWAICWYPLCEHRGYIGCMGNLLVLTLCTQGLHRLLRQFVGTHIVHIGPTQVDWAICWYPQCAHRAYIGGMGNLLVPTLCTQSLHRLFGQFVGTHIVHIGPTYVAWAICWYSHCAHRAYIGCMGNLLVPTLCTQTLHRLFGQFVGTHIVHIGPTYVAWAICWYSHCAHRAYIGCIDNLLVLTLCTQSLHRLHGQFVGTHIVHIELTQVVWAICWYPHCAHRAYIGCMGNLLVLTLCTQGLHRLHGQFVGTHIVHIVPTQVAWAICWYPHCERRGYIGCMGNLLVLTLYTQGLHRLHGQFVGTHIVHIEPTQVAWAICWYPHCAHRTYIGCMGNLLVPTLCTQNLHRLHGQFVGTHIVHIVGLHRLHGQFVGTHIVHIEPTQVACAICWYPHCAHKGLHRLHGQFVGTHIVNIGATQVAWAICWYSHCAHRAYIGCMGNLLEPTLCTQSLHRLLGQFVGTPIVHIGPTQVAWAICWYSHCAHRAYIGCMGNLLVLTLCTQGLH